MVQKSMYVKIDDLLNAPFKTTALQEFEKYLLGFNPHFATTVRDTNKHTTP